VVFVKDIRTRKSYCWCWC